MKTPNKLNGKETKMSAVIETEQGLDFGTTESWELNKGKMAIVKRNGFEIRVNLTDTRSSYRSNYPKVRISIDGEDDVDFSEAYRLAEEAGTHRRGECVEADKAFDKGNRQVVKNQKAVVAEAIQKFEELSFLKGVKFNFSRYCFCSCPCSPGLIGEARPFIEVPVESLEYNGETDTFDKVMTTRMFQVATVSVWKSKD
jgi:hypothetical protein